MMAKEVLPPTILVIFGITGDLSRRYLLPALAEIMKTGHIEDNFVILGVSRRSVAAEDVVKDENLRLKSRMIQMDVENAGDYKRLKTEISDLKKAMGVKAQIIFYLVVPPGGVPSLIQKLGQAKLNGPGIKLMLEKPFGTDLASAKKLIDHTSRYFKEEQVYRIDHYLAKEMAQNITVFLGSNSIFRSIWDGRQIDKIEIEVSEEIGVAGREEFYEPTGAMRDIIQSHGLQLAALTLMEPCANTFDFEEIPRRRLAALAHLTADVKSAIRGQYRGYRQEVGAPGSVTETFAAVHLQSSDERWRGVPISIATGKKLNQRLTEVRVFFRPVNDKRPDALRLRVQPREGIELDLWVKSPGYRSLAQLPLSFSYDQHFGRLPNAYEQVLIDAMTGNHSLFAGSGEILASWEILDPIIKHWQNKGAAGLKMYEPGASLERIIRNSL